MEGENKNIFVQSLLDLVLIDDGIELASVNDEDLMRLKVYSCHEGINENNVEFTRGALIAGYRTFIDKPLVISPDRNGMPRGHGYDFKKKKFIDKERLFIGHIVNAYPCIVGVNGDITDVTYIEQENFPVGELRIICEMVVYKQYVASFAETIANLHFSENLKFSMESYCDQYTTEDGVQHCTSIHFTGLAIVNSPAFKNSFSLEIAEKEEDLMDFEKLYNDEHEKVETLIAEKTTLENEKATLVSDKETLANELVGEKEKVIEANAALVDANAEIENLKTYKEKVETAEKLVVGKERLEKLSKYGKTEKTEEQLAEVTKEEFVDILSEAVDNYKPSNKGYKGLPNTETKPKYGKDRLLELLSELSK